MTERQPAGAQTGTAETLTNLYDRRTRLVDELLLVDIEIGVAERSAVQSQTAAMTAGPYAALAEQVERLRNELRVAVARIAALEAERTP